MSVAHLSARELGLFVALQIKLEICPRGKFAECLNIAEQISVGNCKAWADSYEDQIYPVNADDIEREALTYLADKTGRMALDHCGPIAYNCISQNGNCFFGAHESKDLISQAHELIRGVEDRCYTWQKSERARIERQAENDLAYRDVEPLEMLPTVDVANKCRELGYSRVIVAEYHVDESDIQTDYFSHRTARSVVIGFGQGKRESFKQLREAAARFEPTKQFGPGCDVWTARVVFANDIRGNGCCYYAGQSSPWHREENDSNATFTTEAGASAWAEQCGPINDVNVDGQTANFEWSLNCESIENRENYSMGGGNYLGSYRHNTGWKVRSWDVTGWKSTSTERVEVLPFEEKQAKPVKVAKKKAVEVELIERNESENDFANSIAIQLRHGKTSCVFCQSTFKKDGRKYWSVHNGKSRQGKTFWYESNMRSSYRSTAMAAMIDFAMKLFAEASKTTPEEQAEPELTIDTSDIEAIAWL